MRPTLHTLTLLAILTLAYTYGQVTPTFDSPTLLRPTLAILIGILGIISLFLFPNFKSKKAAALAIIIPAIVIRLAVTPAAPSDDIHRYLWEGKLVQNNVDPYAVTADHPTRYIHRDAHWEKMNHRDKPTAYPPLTLKTFALINGISYHPNSYKLTFLILEILLIATILALLHHYRLPLRHASFYTLSPLAIIAFAVEAHFDILMLLPLVLALLTHAKRLFTLTAVLLAVAIHFKFMAAVAVPFLLWRTPVRSYLAFLTALLVPLIPHWENLPKIAEAVLLFSSTRSFNGPSYQLLQLLTGSERQLPNILTALLYTTLYLTTTYHFLKKSITPLTAAAIALTALVLLSPTVHFWYIVWLLPLACLAPRASLISLSVTAPLYLLVWHQLETTGTWQLPLYAKILHWLPFALILIWEILGNRRLIPTSTRKFLTSPQPIPKITIIIPTLNPGSHIQKAIHSITQQTTPPHQIIISDAHSTDQSLDPIQQPNLRIIKSQKGRGIQIKTGIQAATTDWILILHADATLPKNTIRNLTTHLLRNPTTIAGCLGQRFNATSPGLLLVEILNELRALFARTSFGDQTQFLHRPTALQNDCLTEQPLMEDIEMSDRLRAHGPIIYLGNETTVSAEKWQKHPFHQRFTLIIKFFIQYRLQVWKPKQQRQELAEKLVQQYYKQ